MNSSIPYSSSSSASTSVFSDDLALLRSSLSHLISSNAELNNEIEQNSSLSDSDRKEFLDSIEENTALIERRKREILELEKFLAEATGRHYGEEEENEKIEDKNDGIFL